MRKVKQNGLLAIECIIYKNHVAKVGANKKGGGYNIYCPDCKTRIFITADVFQELDRANKIGKL